MQNRQALETLFVQSKSGNRATVFPPCDVPANKPLDALFPEELLAEKELPLPELSELDIVRHFTNLAMRNMSVDTNFYPLGSCTMKYNPKRNEAFSSSPKLLGLHPYQPESTAQGQLEIFFELQQMLAEIAGLPAVSLQPAAGAHGELTALLVAEKYFKERGEKRTTVLIPDGAHGTNPASAAFAGYQTVEIKSDAGGFVDLADLQSKLNAQTAVFMITNPNTLGIFEKNIRQICAAVHTVGGLVYLDGANMNAIAGIARPGDFGADMMHYNVHKTFSTPHGAGGPGAGPIAVRDFLAPFLPTPVVVKKGGEYRLETPSKTIGKVRTFFGSTAILNRTWFYLRTLGAEGVRSMTKNSVLNANYLLSLLKDSIDVPYGDRCMHEFVASSAKLKAEKGITTMDVAKRLLDFGFHAPTVYFPMLVKEAMMIEPTETENKRTLDLFAVTLKKILAEDSQYLHDAPYTTGVSRPDEVAAAKKPVLVEVGRLRDEPLAF